VEKYGAYKRKTRHQQGTLGTNKLSIGISGETRCRTAGSPAPIKGTHLGENPVDRALKLGYYKFGRKKIYGK